MWGEALRRFTLGEGAPAGGVDGDAGLEARRRHRGVQWQQRIQPRHRRPAGDLHVTHTATPIDPSIYWST